MTSNAHNQQESKEKTEIESSFWRWGFELSTNQIIGAILFRFLRLHDSSLLNYHERRTCRTQGVWPLVVVLHRALIGAQHCQTWHLALQFPTRTSDAFWRPRDSDQVASLHFHRCTIASCRPCRWITTRWLWIDSSTASIMDLDDAGSDGGSHSELETETSNKRAKSQPKHLRSDSYERTWFRWFPY